MYTTMTTKGQITIPIEIREQLGFCSGEQLNLEIRDGILVLTPVLNDIQAAFGLLKARKSVSLEDMDNTIEQAAVENYGQS